jgi:hypothetical protein
MEKIKVYFIEQKQLLLYIELIIFFVLFPLIGVFSFKKIYPLPYIIIGGILSSIYLCKKRSFRVSKFSFLNVKKYLPEMLYRFFLLSILSLITTFIFWRDDLFLFINKGFYS